MATLQDPYKGFRFKVDIDQITQAGFMECTGFGSHLEVIEYREGGDPKCVRKFTGKATVGDVQLKWGMTDNMDLYNWHMNSVNGLVDRRTVSVIQLDDTGTEKLRWNLHNAWLSKFEGPGWNAKGNELSIISVTLTYEYSVMA